MTALDRLQARILPFPGMGDSHSRDAREFLPAALDYGDTPFN